MTITLKPCPFCGTTPEGQDVGQFVVECPSCAIVGPACDSRTLAIAAWNTRAALTQGAGEAVEPVAWGVWDSMFFYDFFQQEDAAHSFCARKNAEPADNLQPYRYAPLYTAPPAQQLQQAVAREREKWTAIADRLLAHCGEGECETCSEIICPHGDTLHFHHDGCPTCEQEAAAIRQQGTP